MSTQSCPTCGNKVEINSEKLLRCENCKTGFINKSLLAANQTSTNNIKEVNKKSSKSSNSQNTGNQQNANQVISKKEYEKFIKDFPEMSHLSYEQ